GTMPISSAMLPDATRLTRIMNPAVCRRGRPPCAASPLGVRWARITAPGGAGASSKLGDQCPESKVNRTLPPRALLPSPAAAHPIPMTTADRDHADSRLPDPLRLYRIVAVGRNAAAHRVHRERLRLVGRELHRRRLTRDHLSRLVEEL